MSTAVVLGATGLVGEQIVAQLLQSGVEVITIGRRTSGKHHPRLFEHVVDLTAPESWAHLVKGDVAFSALGTTMNVAKTKEAQRAVDYGMQLEFARAARANGVPAFVLISSAGADASSAMFYLGMKGELERDVIALGFPRWRILRPGLLDGERKEKRVGERVMKAVLTPLAGVLPAKLRPVHVSIVARAAIAASNDSTSGILEPTDIFARGVR